MTRSTTHKPLMEGGRNMIEVEYREEIAILQLAHGKANALDVELCQGLVDRLQEQEHSSARAVILTGKGKVFSAGVDLVRVLNGGPAYLHTFLPALSLAFKTLFFFPKPVVAAINGHAIAGGCVLACAADHRVIARDAGRIGVPELQVGVPFPTIALEIMRFVSSPHHFQNIIYHGTTFLPEDAAERGLADEIVEPQDLMDQALAAATVLASLPAATFQLTKRQIRQAVRERLQKDGPNFDTTVHTLWATRETQHAIREYISRTLKKADK